VKKAPIPSNAAVSSELAASTMAFSSSSSALEKILGDRQLFRHSLASPMMRLHWIQMNLTKRWK